MVNVRKIKDIPIDKFREDLAESELVQNPPDDVIRLVSMYYETMSRLLDKYAPLTVKEIHDRPNTTWFNDKIISAKKKRRKAERLWRTKLTVHRDLLKEAHREVKG